MYAVTKDFCAVLQCNLSVLTHKFNLVELLVVAVIANEGSILLMKFVSILRKWVTVSCHNLSETFYLDCANSLHSLKCSTLK